MDHDIKRLSISSSIYRRKSPHRRIKLSEILDLNVSFTKDMEIGKNFAPASPYRAADNSKIFQPTFTRSYNYYSQMANPNATIRSKQVKHRRIKSENLTEKKQENLRPKTGFKFDDVFKAEKYGTRIFGKLIRIQLGRSTPSPAKILHRPKTTHVTRIPIVHFERNL